MVWVVSRYRLKVETSSTRSQKSINSERTHEISSLEGTSSRYGVYRLDSQTASTSAHRIPCTLIADKGEKINDIN
jgi:phosphodiesterase/alkaline phosphatase D-like protein